MDLNPKKWHESPVSVGQLIIAILSGLAGIAYDRLHVGQQIAQNTQHIADHETRLNVQRTDINSLQKVDIATLQQIVSALACSPPAGPKPAVPQPATAPPNR